MGLGLCDESGGGIMGTGDQGFLRFLLQLFPGSTLPS